MIKSKIPMLRITLRVRLRGYTATLRMTHSINRHFRKLRYCNKKDTPREVPFFYYSAYFTL